MSKNKEAYYKWMESYRDIAILLAEELAEVQPYAEAQGWKQNPERAEKLRWCGENMLALKYAAQKELCDNNGWDLEYEKPAKSKSTN